MECDKYDMDIQKNNIDELLMDSQQIELFSNVIKDDILNYVIENSREFVDYVAVEAIKSLNNNIGGSLL